MKLQNFSLDSGMIRAELIHEDYEFDYLIDRGAFDRWLTDGKMEFDAGVDGPDGQHIPNIISMDEYWQAAVEINDTEVKKHVQLFLDAKREKEVLAAYHHDKLNAIISRECDPAVSIMIRKQLGEYREAYRNVLIQQPKAA